MRVPDLSWPINLFADIITLRPESIVVGSAVSSATSTSWTELADSWSANDGPVYAREASQMFDAGVNAS